MGSLALTDPNTTNTHDLFFMCVQADDIRPYIVERRGRRSLLSAFCFLLSDLCFLLSDLCFLRSAFHFDEKLEVFIHFLLQSVYLGTFAVHQFIVAVDFFLCYLLG